MNENRIIKRSPLRNSFRDLEELENRFLGNFFSPTWGNWRETLATSQLVEDQNNYYLTIELPGISKDKIKIDAGEKYLHVHGEKKEEKLPEGQHLHYSEMTYGSFSREYHFPAPIDREKVTANSQQGLLKLTIPKATQNKLKQININ